MGEDKEGQLGSSWPFYLGNSAALFMSTAAWVANVHSMPILSFIPQLDFLVEWDQWIVSIALLQLPASPVC